MSVRITVTTSDLDTQGDGPYHWFDATQASLPALPGVARTAYVRDVPGMEWIDAMPYAVLHAPSAEIVGAFVSPEAAAHFVTLANRAA